MQNQTIVQKAFIKIMEERVFQVAWEKAKADELYVKAIKEKEIAIDLLRDSLKNGKQKNLLDDLESVWEFVDRVMQEYAYRQGLQDSQMIHKELNTYGIDVSKESMDVML
ncbi:hypothetical protein FOH38_12355 [Lysinibacillus fusiformis]|nr:hypothetical protein FOH38_12355 [Lysinibacillus fusiformis]